VKLYHRTAAGDAILAEGFKDQGGTYLTTNWYEGVWLSDRPLDANEGASGRDLLVVDIPEDALADYEWVEEGKPYREWLVPAELVNRYPVSQVAQDDEDDLWTPEGWS
jgi:hypothetical protein